MCDIDKPFPLFGAKYNFHLEGVVDCPEFLVYFPVLEKSVHLIIINYSIYFNNLWNRLAKSYGLELKMKMTFAEYFEKRSNLDAHLLNRLTALEVFDYKNNICIL